MKAVSFMTVVLFISIAIVPARAQQVKQLSTGNDFLEMCAHVNDEPTTLQSSLQSYADGIKLGECMGYLAGVHGNLQATQLIIGAASKDDAYGRTLVPICVPSGVTAGQLVRVVNKWLTDHPAVLQNPFAISAFFALEDAFPCKQASKEADTQTPKP